jgi:hypothetical protein
MFCVWIQTSYVFFSLTILWHERPLTIILLEPTIELNWLTTGLNYVCSPSLDTKEVLYISNPVRQIDALVSE